MNYRLSFTYKADNQKKTVDCQNDDVAFDLQQNANGLKLTVIPKKAISDISFYLEREYDFSGDKRFFANGFQSWTDTKEFAKGEMMADEGLI